MPSFEWNKQEWAKQLGQFAGSDLPFYGSQWGNPDPRAVFPPPLRALMPEGVAAALLEQKRTRRWLHRLFRPPAPYYPPLFALVRERIRPFVTPEAVVLEIGPGGGRFTRYLLAAREIILVDIVPEFFPYLRQRFPQAEGKFRFYQSSGAELTGIADASVDFVFSFDAFVHIEPDGIRDYLGHIQRVLKPEGTAVIHYGDITKEEARKPGRCFAPMTGDLMDTFASGLPAMRVVAHDKDFLLHSNLIVLQKAAAK